MLWPEKPTNGIVRTPDGEGGTFTNSAELVGGPFNTLREVCQSAPAKARTQLGCPKDGSKSDPARGSSSADDPTPIVKIIAIRGDAGFLHGKSDWQELSVGQQLPASDQIHTGPDSEVTMELISPAFARSYLHGHIIVIKALTQLKMRQFSDPNDIFKIELELKIGEIKAQVHPQETIRTDFTIKTPTAVCGVRGTIFTVKHDGRTQITTVGVEEGTVLVTPTNSALRPFLLPAGRQVTVASNGVGPVTSTTVGGRQVAPSIPRVIKECETYQQQICGTWTLQGKQFHAEWQNGAVATLMVQRFDNGQVLIIRQDTGATAGFTARYSGQLSGNKIERGTVTWTSLAA
jgi:hypothetical protein